MDAVLLALVGLAGIGAAFFAPTYSRRRLDDRRAERELRVAARLVSHDLNVIAAQLNLLVQQRSLDATLDDLLPVAAWDDNRAALAGALPLEDWRIVANAFGRAASLRPVLGNGHPSLDAKAEALLTDAAKKAQAARDVLAAVAE